MDKFIYHYLDKTKFGYRKIYFSIAELKAAGVNLNRLRKCGGGKVDVYFSEQHGYYFEYLTSWIGFLVLLMCFPFDIVINFVADGINGVKEMLQLYKRMLNEKKYGAFTSDRIFPSDGNVFLALEKTRKFKESLK